MKFKLPSSVYNWITLIGATIAVITLFMIVFLFTISFFLVETSSYLGLVIYIILPAFLVAGLILIPIGMWRKRRKDIGKTAEEKSRDLPRVDLNNPQHRNAFAIFAIGTVIFLFLSAVGSYEAYHYTESVEFCGTVCHEVMKPEYTAYQDSPHARVACVGCHVGAGADWYVKSKLSGLRQVYGVLTDDFSRPIPTPIENLRPARETCEACHWPQKFYARKQVQEKHFLPDDENTEWDIYLTMKVGPTHSADKLNEGIHWHINPDVKIEYAATDDKMQEIPWVRYTNRETGEEYVYHSEENRLEEGALDTLEIQTMDCIDCHNRPSHVYDPPAFFVNNAMAAGEIPKDLPEIKSLAMEIFAEEFGTTDSALAYIDSSVSAFYSEDYPEIAESDPGKINRAKEGLKNAFSKNIFPEMKVRWEAYPNNIGHVEYNGCFRCHNDMHATDEGDVIKKDCNLCHSISAQGSPDSLQTAAFGEELAFVHPEDIGGAWEMMLCTECHTGLNP